MHIFFQFTFQVLLHHAACTEMRVRAQHLSSLVQHHHGCENDESMIRINSKEFFREKNIYSLPLGILQCSMPFARSVYSVENWRWLHSCPVCVHFFVITQTCLVLEGQAGFGASWKIAAQL